MTKIGKYKISLKKQLKLTKKTKIKKAVYWMKLDKFNINLKESSSLRN